MLIVRCPSGSKVKLDAIRRAFDKVGIVDQVDIRGLPVELQDRPDMQVNAQPEGWEETSCYALLRLDEMRRQHGPTVGIDISIESGAIDNQDVAIVVTQTADGQEFITGSTGISFPAGTLDEARHRGFKTTTAGDIIHKHHPEIPSNSWQAHFWSYMSREEQITEAVVDGLQHIKKPRS